MRLMLDFLSHDLPYLDHGSNHCRSPPENHCQVLHLEISKWKRKFQVCSAITLREISNQIFNFIHLFLLWIKDLLLKECLIEFWGKHLGSWVKKEDKYDIGILNLEIDEFIAKTPAPQFPSILISILNSP